MAAEKAAKEQREREDKRRRQQAQEARKRRQEQEERRQEQEERRKSNERFGRGLAFVGLGVAVVGVGSGWLESDGWVARAGIPYAIFAIVSILLSAVGLRFTVAGVAAAAGGWLIAVAGSLLLFVTMIVQLWRIWIDDQTVGWGPPVAALVGALLWFGGASMVMGGAVLAVRGVSSFLRRVVQRSKTLRT
jgi:hypothetical protein